MYLTCDETVIFQFVFLKDTFLNFETQNFYQDTYTHKNYKEGTRGYRYVGVYLVSV